MQIPTSIGPYQVIRKLATGGMAEIFVCRQVGPGGFERPIVVKRIHAHLAGDPDFVAMFISEAQVAAGLSHSNIVQIMDFGEADGSFFIAMEYVDGPNLKVVVRRGLAQGILLPIPLCAYILEQTAAALDCAHKHRDAQGRPLDMVHRDVSPQNILTSYAGEVKLTDFGIAKVASSSRDSKVGTLKGKIAYMSPEQSRGKRIDSRSDIFSLGIVGFEILTGQRLFFGSTDLATLEKVRAAQVPSMRDVDPTIPVELERILLKALSPEPDDRYETSEAMQYELALLASSLGPYPPATDLGELVTAVMEEPQDVPRLQRMARSLPGAIDPAAPAGPAPQDTRAGDTPSGFKDRFQGMLDRLIRRGPAGSTSDDDPAGSS